VTASARLLSKQPERAAYWSGHAAVMQARILKNLSEVCQAFAESFGSK
jgi:hypothetical protein